MIGESRDEKKSQRYGVGGLGGQEKWSVGREFTQGLVGSKDFNGNPLKDLSWVLWSNFEEYQYHFGRYAESKL